MDSPLEDSLSWDDTYAIARALNKIYPDVDLEQVSLMMIYEWTLALKDFHDDPQLSNDAILLAIYTDWFEEVNSI
jgi:FeS assembly protein IscX